MRFKSNAQRCKVMLMLQKQGFSKVTSKYLVEREPENIKVYGKKGSKEKIAIAFRGDDEK